MIWVPIVVVVVLLLLGLWAFVLAPPGESAELTRRQAHAAQAARRLAEAYDEALPLTLVMGSAPAPDVLAWTRAGAPLEAPRDVVVRAGQDLLDLLVAASGEHLPCETARDADAEAQRGPTFAATQHPLAGRVDLFELEELRTAVLPLLRRWAGEGGAALAEALVEFGASDLEADVDPAAVSAVEAALAAGTTSSDEATHQAAALVRPLLEGAEAALAAGASLALLWLPDAGAAPLALRTIAPAPPPPPPEAPPTDLDPALTEAARLALGAELEARGIRAGADPDGAFTLEGTPLRVRAWPYARETRGGERVAAALEVEVNLEGERRTFRLGFVGDAPAAEQAQRLALSAGTGLALTPLLDAAAPPREDVVRWSPTGAAGDAPAAYEVHLGPISLEGRPTPEHLEGLLERHPFRAVRDALGPQLARRLHLLDLRAARSAGGPVQGEVRLDGQPWAEGLPLLAALPWPEDTPHLGLRAVVVLRAARL